MARWSAEARSGAAFRAGGAPPAPPKHLARPVADLWVTIVAAKPHDWFDAGSLVLLEAYCETVIHARTVAKRLERLRKAEAWEEAKPWEQRYLSLSRALMALATKLRLTVQSLVDRRSRGILQRGHADAKSDPLLAGGGRKKTN